MHRFGQVWRIQAWRKVLNIQEDHFGRSEFLAVLTSEGYFRNYKKLVRFLEKAISRKIIADFQSFKTS